MLSKQPIEDTDAFAIFKAALLAVQPANVLPNCIGRGANGIKILYNYFRHNEYNRLIVLAVGKAASAMAQSAEMILQNAITTGICITKYDHALPLNDFETFEAAHPVPDQNSVLAADALVKAVETCNDKDIVLVLLSGGASSLAVDVPVGCTLKHVQQLFAFLVNSGASIAEINVVRMQMSGIKGGGLARLAAPAKIYTLAISDVPGDDESIIGSGLTVPQYNLLSRACNTLDKYNAWPHVAEGLLPCFKQARLCDEEERRVDNNNQYRIIASNAIAVQAAYKYARKLGYALIDTGRVTYTHIDSMAEQLTDLALSYSGVKPACLVAGGEINLAVKGQGKGGRNQHLALAVLAHWLRLGLDAGKITLLCAGTDGTDGPTLAAGAQITWPGSYNKHDVQKHLEEFDAWHFFNAYGGLIETGATQTNVMDMLILILH